MLASKAISRLRNTELKQLSATSLTDAVIIEFLNEAILELHKRFNLWQDDAIITHATDVITYVLDGIDSNVAIDLSDKQLIVITDAIDYLGDEMTINDEDNEFGIVTPKYNVVEYTLEELVVGEDFDILFRAAPLDMTADTDTIDLPPTLFEAMYFYAGFRGHISQKGGKQTVADSKFKLYNESCDRVQALGLVVAETSVSHKFAGLTYPWP
jgi:hypothetical protein